MIYQDEIDTLRKAADELERKQREYIEKSKGYYVACRTLRLPGDVRKITTVDLIGRRTPESAEALCEENKRKCVKVSPETYNTLIKLSYILKAKQNLELVRGFGPKMHELHTHITDVIEEHRQMMNDLGFEGEVLIRVTGLSS